MDGSGSRIWGRCEGVRPCGPAAFTAPRCGEKGPRKGSPFLPKSVAGGGGGAAE